MLPFDHAAVTGSRMTSIALSRTEKNKAPLEGRAGPRLQTLLTARRNNNEREEEEGEALSCRRRGI